MQITMITALTVLLSLTLMSMAPEKSSAPLKILSVGETPAAKQKSWLRLVPDFSLTERTGSKINLADLRGKVWIADFIYTQCSDSCSLQTANLAKLQEQWRGSGELRVVSFSVDPERDTPQVLTRYAKRFHADRRWLFLTGDKAQMAGLIEDGFHQPMAAVSSRQNHNPKIIHSARFILIDRDAQIRGSYDSSDRQSMERLKRDVSVLLSQRWGARDPVRRQPPGARGTTIRSIPATKLWPPIKLNLFGNKNAMLAVLRRREFIPRRSIMASNFNRRDFLKLAGIGGVVFASGIGCSTARNGSATADSDEFYFVQLSDTHWGFTGPEANPDAAVTLPKAVAAVNELKVQPDFIVFTGDLTHTTEDPKERRRRLGEFKEIVSRLRVNEVRFMPGEHDGSLDQSKAFQEFFGSTHYTFDHKGVHFIVLDNVSDPRGRVGDEQLQWLDGDLKKQKANAKIVVFTHRPLFDLYPQWDWATADGAQATKILMQQANVTVFYGHIHQEHHHMTGNIAHHAAKSLIFPLPPPGSQPKRAPIPWNAATPYKGLGFREVEAEVDHAKYDITEFPVVRS